MNHLRVAGAAVLLLLLNGACGGKPAVSEEASSAPAPTDDPAEDLDDSSPPIEAADEEARVRDEFRLEDWPNADSRLWLQLSEPGQLEFSQTAFEEAATRADVDALRFDGEHLIVRVGPVGEWYAHDTLYLLVSRKSHELVAAGSYAYSDVRSFGGWASLSGKVVVDSSSPPESGRFRCRIELTEVYEPPPEEADAPSRSDSPLNGIIEVATVTDSDGLRLDLESFGVSFEADAEGD